jgi:hypothetical protein
LGVAAAAVRRRFGLESGRVRSGPFDEIQNFIARPTKNIKTKEYPMV